MPRCIVVPVVLVEFCNFIVDVIIDVRLWYRTCKWRVWFFCQFICLFIFPNTCVGSNPSLFQGVGGSEMIEGIEAFNDCSCSAFDVECCYSLDRR